MLEKDDDIQEGLETSEDILSTKDEVEENSVSSSTVSDDHFLDFDNSDPSIHETMSNDELENMLKMEKAKLTESATPYGAISSENSVVDSDKPVTVQPVQFASFEEEKATQVEPNKNLDILMDIKLQLTVELGKSVLPIKKVLELTRGSIVELDRVAGEPVDLYANGKLIAHGEVVVIEDNFGLRITGITNPEERLRSLQ